MQPEEVAPRYLRRRVVVKMSQISYELFLSFCQDNRLMLILQIINQHVHIIITSHAPLIKSSSSSSATRKDGISSERTHRSKDKSDSNSKEAAARDGVQGSSGESGGASDEAHGRRRGANGEAESGLSGDNLSDPRKSGVGSMGGGRSGAGDRPAKDSAGNGTNHYNKSDDTNGMPGKEINSLPIRWGMLQDVADLYHSNHARQMSHSTSHSTSSAAAGATLTTEKGRTKDRQEGKGSSGGGSVDSLYTPVGRADKDKDQDKASSDTVERGAFLPKPDHKQHKRIKQVLDHHLEHYVWEL